MSTAWRIVCFRPARSGLFLSKVVSRGLGGTGLYKTWICPGSVDSLGLGFQALLGGPGGRAPRSLRARKSHRGRVPPAGERLR